MCFFRSPASAPEADADDERAGGGGCGAAGGGPGGVRRASLALPVQGPAQEPRRPAGWRRRWLLQHRPGAAGQNQLQHTHHPQVGAARSHGRRVRRLAARRRRREGPRHHPSTLQYE